MKYPMFCIRDNKVGFMTPFVEQNDDAAIRGFSYSLNGENGIMNFSPADYDLYKIGEFDTEKGTIEGQLPNMIVSGPSVFGTKNG